MPFFFSSIARRASDRQRRFAPPSDVAKMPVSKRAKKVSLTKVKKKAPSAGRSQYVDKLRQGVEARPNLFVVEIDEHSRPTQFKALRTSLPGDSALFLGKQTLMKVALGDCEENELKPAISKLSGALKGGHALIATDAPRAAVVAALEGCRAPEFATAGFVPDEHVVLEKGELDVAKYPVSMLAVFKKMDMPVEVQDSKLVLIDNFRVASKNKPISAEQAKMLTHMDLKLHEFAPAVVASYVDGDFSAP